MAKFKKGDKAILIIGTYPADYRGVKFEPEPEIIGSEVVIAQDGHDYYGQVYITDYEVHDAEGNSLGLIDEVHLKLLQEDVVKLPEPDQYVVDSALALHAFEILERIEAKLTGIEERLAAHEERANQSTAVVINVTGTVSMPAEMAAIAPQPSVEPEPIGSVAYDEEPNRWLDMHDKAEILSTFQIGDKVEFTQGARYNGGYFIGYIQGFDVSDRDQFLDIVWDKALYDGSRWPDLSYRKVRKVTE